MKKTFFLLIALLFTLSSWAYDFVDNGIYYNITGTNAVEITYSAIAAKDYSGDVQIPPTVENNGITYNVTGIGVFAFLACDGLTSIKIPNSMTEIGVGTFAGCNALQSFYVSSGNPKYSSVDGVLYSDGGTVLMLYPQAKPDVNFIIPEGTVSIGQSALASCQNLVSVELPTTLTSIEGTDPFGSCIALQSFAVASGNTKYSTINDVLYSDGGTVLIQYPPAKADVNFIIPEGTLSLKKSAFSSCQSLVSVDLPSTLTMIETGAFNVTSCNKLSSFSVQTSNSIFSAVEGVLYKGDTLFIYPWAKTAENFSIPTGVKMIESSVFSSNTYLKTVTIPQTVDSIGNTAFLGCTNLSVIKVAWQNPAEVSCGNLVFYSINISAELWVPLASAELYEQSSVWGVFASVNRYCINPDFIIDGNGDLTGYTGGGGDVIIPTGVKSIAQDAFKNNLSITSIIIPNTVTSIGESAFAGCINLTSVAIPESVNKIDRFAFLYCTGLQQISTEWQKPKIVQYGDGIFTSVPQSCIVNIPVGTLNDYQIQPWLFFDNINNITSLTEVNTSGCRIYSRNRNIIIENANSPVSIYSINSRFILCGEAKEFPVPQAGVYIVQMDDVTRKVIVK